MKIQEHQLENYSEKDGIQLGGGGKITEISTASAYTINHSFGVRKEETTTFVTVTKKLKYPGMKLTMKESCMKILKTLL